MAKLFFFSTVLIPWDPSEIIEYADFCA